MNGAGNGEVRLERRLVLSWWFARKLGYSSPERMLSELKGFNGEWDDCHPALGGILNGEHWRTAQEAIPEAELREYDRGLRGDLGAMNHARGSERISLRYFQYLALLASEHFLARRAAPLSLAEELNSFARRVAPAGTLWPEFRGEEDLDKLALWMATGSGKTLLMHLHYRQFFRRLPFSPDNVVLLTPNEQLSAQHLRDMRRSGIPCGRHGEEGLWGASANAVRVLECTKLRVGKKPGAGATEGTDSFEGRNLVFADEGHRGAGGDVFMEARRALSRGGFCFEYSATFGQALCAARDAELAAEYGRAIALDYSYKHFYRDGYGKDFRVLNLRGDPPEEKKDAVMLGNLLSFCQQRMLHAENKRTLAEHNLEPPLLLLLGKTVSGGANEAEWDTDLVNILLFLHRASLDPERRLAGTASEILRGTSGIPAQAGGDAFAGRLEFLRGRFGEDGVAAMTALRKSVFGSESPAPLRLRPVKNAQGEIGLSAGEGPPFGLAFVGDPAKLRRLALNRGQPEGMEALDDAVGNSLFAGINRPHSPVNILIGAKKFMEGWSSWRVSGMGLLNVGTGEGSQIIQLFGRGVRLKGRNMSLKRSSEENWREDAEQLKTLRALETLNVFGLRADFMGNFANFLEREGVTEEETLEVPLRDSDPEFFRRGLLVPDPPLGRFSETTLVSANPEGEERVPHVTVDLSTRTHMVSGDDWEGSAAAAGGTIALKDRAEVVSALDFNELHRRLLRRREEAGFFNLLILRGELKDILLKRCSVIAPNFDAPKSFAESRTLHDIAASALWKFSEALLRARRKRWETQEMKYAPLDRKSDGNFPRHYTVRAASREVAERVRRLLEDCKRLYKESDAFGASPLPRIYFSRHLYQPLLAELKSPEEGVFVRRDPARHAQILFPPELNAGERDFVEALRDRLSDEDSGAEYFLLRNLSRGKGVGFFTDAGFYPDFILWIKRGESQRIVFIEPHGLLLDLHPDYNPKVRLHKLLTEISERLARTPEWKSVRMGAFIVSQTGAEDLRTHWGNDWTDEKLGAHHILFPQVDNSHIAQILRWAND